MAFLPNPGGMAATGMALMPLESAANAQWHEWDYYIYLPSLPALNAPRHRVHVLRSLPRLSPLSMFCSALVVPAPLLFQCLYLRQDSLDVCFGVDAFPPIAGELEIAAFADIQPSQAVHGWPLRSAICADAAMHEIKKPEPNAKVDRFGNGPAVASVPDEIIVCHRQATVHGAGVFHVFKDDAIEHRARGEGQ